MEFFNALSLDLKLLVAGIAGCALLTLFSGSRKVEQRCLVVMALLAVVGVYRLPHGQPTESSAAESTPRHFITVTTKHTPIVSTSAR